MSALLAIAAVSGVGSAYLFAVQAISARRDVRVSLARAAGMSTASPQGDRERQRRFASLTARAAQVALTVRRGRTRDDVALDLMRAGLLTKLAPEEFLAAKIALSLAGALSGLALGGMAGSAVGGVLFGIVFGTAGFAAPEVLVRVRLQSRREAIRAALPSTLDLLAVSVEAGLGLDAAIARLTDLTDGPLADELTLVLGQMSIGESRADALRKLADRVEVPELTAFVRALLQADRLGLSVARTLKIQASEVRSRRQSAVEEQAAKAPIKMLFPTVFFIFPALFVVVLGPPLMLLGGNL